MRHPNLTLHDTRRHNAQGKGPQAVCFLPNIVASMDLSKDMDDAVKAQLVRQFMHWLPGSG